MILERPEQSPGADQSHMRIGAICISRNPEDWRIPEVPFYNHTLGWRPFEHERTKQRVGYLSERRNTAVARALEVNPSTQHILMIDSYYLGQEEQIRETIREYERLTRSLPGNGCIFGASTWIVDRTRIRPRRRFYDWWTTPEGQKLKLETVERKGGLMKVKAVGGCYLYPRWVWEKVGYSVPEDLHGCEHNWLCEQSMLPVFLGLGQRLWRDPIVYSWAKRIRMTMHLGRFLGN